LRKLDSKNSGFPAMVFGWVAMKSDQELDAVSIQKLLEAVSLAVRNDRDGGANCLGRLESLWQSRNKSEPLAWRDCLRIGRAWLLVGDASAANGPARAKQWTMRAYVAALSDQSGGVARRSKLLDELGRALKRVGLGERVRNTDLETLFARTLAAPSEIRREVWRIGVGLLDEDSLVSADQVMPAVDKFLAELADGEALPAARVLGDLRRLCRDEFLLRELSRRLNQCELDAAMAGSDEELRGLVRLARSFAAAGRTDKAIEIYNRIASDPDRSEGLVRIVRRVLLPLLFEQPSWDLGAIERNLVALEQDGSGPTVELWNMRCRLLFRKLAAADTEARGELWRGGLSRLAGEGISISRETLADLDAVISELDRAGDPMALRIPTDLLLLVPDIPSSSELQLRRVKLLARNEPAEAKKAAKLAIILASRTERGPREVIEISEKIGALPERPRGALPFTGLPTTAAVGGDGVLAGFGRARGRDDQPSFPVDRHLRVAAKRMRGAGCLGPLRREAYVKLVAGGLDGAVVAAYRALLASSEGVVEMALDDLAAVLAVGGAGVDGAERFALWLARRNGRDERCVDAAGGCDPLLDRLIELELASLNSGVTSVEAGGDAPSRYRDMAAVVRRDAARKVVTSWRDRRIRWGIDALQAGDKQRAEAFWSEAVVRAAGSGDLETVLDRIVRFAGRNGVGNEIVLEIFERIADERGLGAARRSLLIKMAEVLYGTGQFAEVVEELDKADAVQPSQRGDGARVGLLRALALIGKGELEGALQALEGIKDWSSASEDQQAQGLFLKSWIRLKAGRIEQARKSLRQLVDKYSHTRFGKRGTELLLRLRGDR